MRKPRIAGLLAAAALTAAPLAVATPAHALSGCSYGVNFSGSNAQGYVHSYTETCTVVLERYDQWNGISILGTATASPGNIAKTGWYYYDWNFLVRACGEDYNGSLGCTSWFG